MTAGATVTCSSDSPSTPDDLYMVYTACGQSAVDAPSGRSKEKADDVTSIVDVQPCNHTQPVLSAIKTLVSEIVWPEEPPKKALSKNLPLLMGASAVIDAF